MEQGYKKETKLIYKLQKKLYRSKKRQLAEFQPAISFWPIALTVSRISAFLDSLRPPNFWIKSYR